VERVQLSTEESSGSCFANRMISEVERDQFCLCHLAAVSVYLGLFQKMDKLTVYVGIWHINTGCFKY
jgi:hypothetical protein